MSVDPASAVVTERRGATAWITLNRPQAINAINEDIRQQLPRAIRDADEDPGVRVMVINGAGERGFCAGADVKGFGEPKSLTEHRMSRVYGHWIDAFENAKKPIIASIHGYCLGGGLEIALACDIRIAAEGAAFALPEVSLGTMPGAGGTQRLARVIGLGRAMDMLLSAERMPAAYAHQIGLISRLVPRDQLESATLALAELIGGHAPIAVMFAKEAMRKGTDPNLANGMKLEIDLLTMLMTTEDRKEAGAAFREKRKPQFKGK
jgi:enoyl-CoA hydratase/carnithine racemase